MAVISGRTTDGVISEPARASMVSTVFPNMPPIRSYVEAAADYFVVKPTSSFVLAPSDEFVRWRTNWGAAPSSCSLRGTMGPLAKLYGFDDRTSWSPSCWNLECPAPGERAGSVADPWRPSHSAFQPYSANVPTYGSTGRCMNSCASKCSGPGDTSHCAMACTDKCMNPMGIGSGGLYDGASSAGYGNDVCTDSCMQRCSNSFDVNSCFLPCSSKCGPNMHK